MPKTRYGQPALAVGIASNGATPVTLYTFGASLKMPDGASGPGGCIDRVRVNNRDTVMHTVELHAIAPTDSLGDDTMFERVPLAAGEVYHYIGGGDRYPSGTIIQIKLEGAHTTNPVYAKPDVSEIY